MYQASLIAKRYATAAFKLIKEGEKEDLFLSSLQTVADIYFDAQLRSILLNPCLSQAKQLEIFAEIAEKIRLGMTIKKFLMTVIEGGRVELLREILRSLQNLIDEEKNIAKGVIEAPVELPEAQKKSLEAKLSNQLKKQVSLTTKINKDLLAGFRVVLKGYVLDQSLKNRLAHLSFS